MSSVLIPTVPVVDKPRRHAYFFRSVVAGANVAMALTSLSAAIVSYRWKRSAEPCMWISNPLNGGPTESVVWNALLTVLFGLAAVMVLAANPRANCSAEVSNGANDAATTSKWACLMLFLFVLAAGRAAYDMTLFAKLLSTKQIASSFPLPLSAVVIGVLLANILLTNTSRTRRVSTGVTTWWRRIGRSLLVLVGLFAGQLLMVFMHILTFGTTDYRREADVAIVLGARVYSDGTLSLALSDRLRSAVRLFEAGQVRTLLVSGATGVEGINEATTMREFLIQAGIPPDRVLMDEQGINTLASARNSRRIMAKQGLTSALIVSHYFHLARSKLLFEEQGISCVTVPAHMSRRLAYEPYYVARECAGYLWYALTRPLWSSPPASNGMMINGRLTAVTPSEPALLPTATPLWGLHHRQPIGDVRQSRKNSLPSLGWFRVREVPWRESHGREA